MRIYKSLNLIILKLKKSMKGKKNIVEKFLEHINECDGCQVELEEALEYKKLYPEDKVYLIISKLDKDNKYHISIFVKNKDGKIVIG